jgi:predicted transcriptional regulator
MKNPVVFFITAIFLLLFSISIAPVSADLGGYTVEPASPDMIAGPPQELVPVGFFELPPRVMAIYLALLISPLLIFPVELFFLFKLFAYFGYREICKKNVLDNPSRNKVYQFIRKTPGTDFSEISRETGVSQNTLRYHLAILKYTKKVTILSTSRNARYFENSGSFSGREQVVLKYLHNRPTRTLLCLLMENPDLTRAEIEKIIGASGTGVTWHMHRLSNDRILSIRKDGRYARYEINSEITPYLEKYLPLYLDVGIT